MSTIISLAFLETFTPSEIEIDGLHKGSSKYIFEFNNGYSASVIQNKFSYGSRQGLWELAIMLDNEVCYDTPIADDVIGYLSDQQVKKYLLDIAALPSKA